VIEQRTGRVDRIGSKTFREREMDGDGGRALLEVGVPFLAGTYDERMYEELRLRSQVFEVLTGGEVSADNLEGRDDVEDAEGQDTGLRVCVLPDEVIGDLRVKLNVGAVRRTKREFAAEGSPRSAWHAESSSFAVTPTRRGPSR
jgi:hypothetical protein